MIRITDILIEGLVDGSGNGLVKSYEDLYKYTPEQIALAHRGGIYSQYMTSAEVFDEYEEVSDLLHILKGALETDFSDGGLKNCPSMPTLYRFLVLTNKKSIDEKNIGHHYITSLKDVDGYWFYDVGIIKAMDKSGGKLYLLECKTSINNIDWEQTIWHRMEYWGENEVTVRDVQKIKVVDTKLIQHSINTSTGNIFT